MPPLLHEILRGQGTRARSLRSTAFVALGFGGGYALRLGSNLILTRLLFPEAFGVMALVQVFLTGLQMFSDLGVNLSIIQDKRGEDRDFLNTAWTIQVLRGIFLWLVSCAIAWPMAAFYGQPELLYLIPVAGLNAVIMGFMTTKVAEANRDLRTGVLVLTELVSQIIGIIVTVLLTLWWRDVWALVAGGIAGSLANVVLLQRMLPGPRNRLHWNTEMAWSILHFGKYILVASVAGFLLNQGDRLVLGAHVSMEALGIFSIGILMAKMPQQLAGNIGRNIVFPIFRRYLDLGIPENRDRVFRARRLVILAMCGTTCLLALVGVPLIELLYDHRYDMAGPVLALASLSTGLQVAVSNYEGAYFAHGDSRSHFRLSVLNAAVQMALLLAGIAWFGLLGAVLAPGLAMILTYPYRVVILRRYKAWDPVTDLAATLAILAATAIACLLFPDQILAFVSGQI